MGKGAIVLFGTLSILVMVSPAWSTPVETRSESDISTPTESANSSQSSTSREERAARIEKRMAQAFCRATESGVLVNTLLAQVEKSFTQQGTRGEVRELTTDLVRELLGIGVEEACTQR